MPLPPCSMSRLLAYLRALAIAVPVWLGVAAVFWVETILDEGEPFTWPRALRSFLSFWAVLALLTPVVFVLTRHLPLSRERWLRPGLALACALLAMTALSFVGRGIVVHNLVTDPAERELLHLEDHWYEVLLQQRSWIPFLLTFYVGLAGVGYAVDARRRLYERDQRAQQLENELVAARLEAMKGHLQPHFLFNTLHAIGVTAPHDGVAAARMITHLGDLLRKTLDSRKSQLVPLREEVELLRPYLEIQKLRFADRLTVHIDVPEALRECLVPSLMLQPIVENAIKHGIETKSGAGRIAIRARAEDDAVVVEVQDDGRGLASGRYDPSRDGIGLSTTRARIAKLYDGRGGFALAPAPQGGAIARIRVPRLTFPKIA